MRSIYLFHLIFSELSISILITPTKEERSHVNVKILKSFFWFFLKDNYNNCSLSKKKVILIYMSKKILRRESKFWSVISSQNSFNSSFVIPFSGSRLRRLAKATNNSPANSFSAIPKSQVHIKQLKLYYKKSIN